MASKHCAAPGCNQPVSISHPTIGVLVCQKHNGPVKAGVWCALADVVGHAPADAAKAWELYPKTREAKVTPLAPAARPVFAWAYGIAHAAASAPKRTPAMQTALNAAHRVRLTDMHALESYGADVARSRGETEPLQPD